MRPSDVLPASATALATGRGRDCEVVGHVLPRNTTLTRSARTEIHTRAHRACARQARQACMRRRPADGPRPMARGPPVQRCSAAPAVMDCGLRTVRLGMDCEVGDDAEEHGSLADQASRGSLTAHGRARKRREGCGMTDWPSWPGLGRPTLCQRAQSSFLIPAVCLGARTLAVSRSRRCSVPHSRPKTTGTGTHCAVPRDDVFLSSRSPNRGTRTSAADLSPVRPAKSQQPL